MDAIATGVTSERLRGLRRWNIGLTVLHGVQALAIVALAGDFAITVTSTFPEGPPGTRLPPAESLFDVPSVPPSPCSSASQPSTTW